MTLMIGQTASRNTTITDAAIRAFAEATGDNNPVHLDADYAAATRFKKRIAHGMLTTGLVSAVLANDLPGPGTIYLSQSLSFKAPVFIEDTITATVEVVAYREDKRITTLKTTCTNQDGTLVLDGEAIVIAPET